MNGKKFDFTGVRIKSPEWYKLLISKMRYVVGKSVARGMDPAEIAKEIGVDKQNIYNILATNKKYTELYKPFENADKTVFYDAYCGELYNLLAKNGIFTFKELEKSVKNRALDTLLGVGASNEKAILAILEDYLTEKMKKSTKKSDKNMTSKEKKEVKKTEKGAKNDTKIGVKKAPKKSVSGGKK